MAGGYYFYCIAKGSNSLSMGPIGLEGSEVYTIPYKDVSAVVHDCAPEPYQSSDGKVLKDWVMAHQRVIEVAWERWGTVLPFGFNTIIRRGEQPDPWQSVLCWLEKEYGNLRLRIDRLAGKAEYGVQIFWQPRTVATNLAQTNQDIQKLNQDILTKPQGLAYMYRQKLENLLKREMETKASHSSQELYGRIRACVDDLRIEKVKRADDATQMLLNLSCLASSENYARLAEELGKIAELEGFSVRFTGPWPPYSFASSA